MPADTPRSDLVVRSGRRVLRERARARPADGGAAPRALPQDTDSDAFAPQPFTADRRRADRSPTRPAQGRRAVTFDSGHAATGCLPRRAASAARLSWSALEPACRTSFDTRAALDVTAACIRVHGDYHLGQVLWSEGDFYLLDFEGEPAQVDRGAPPQAVAAEGRRRHAALVQLRGLRGALFARTPARRDDSIALEPWARVWQLWAGAAFLRGYFETARAALFVPRDPVQRGAAARSLPDRQGAVRTQLRAEQPARLGPDSRCGALLELLPA